MDNYLKDVALASRALLRRPGFTAAAVVSMGLGIGANSTVFTLVDAALLRPLPVREPERVAVLYVTDESRARYLPISYPNYEDLSRQTRVFSGLAAFQWLHPSLQHGEEPEKIFVQIVTPGYFEVLGVKAAQGRAFTPEDYRAGASPAAILSHSFWRRELGGNSAVLGATIRLNQLPITVVGVMPERFKGTSTFKSPELWLPISMYEQISPYARHFENRGAQMFEMVGRLEPGVSFEQANSELATLAARLAQDHPQVNQGDSLLALPLRQAAIEPQQRAVYVGGAALLLAFVGVLQLIACGNVASLLLARGLEQRREIAIRLALGARRGQLIQQLVVQSLILSLAGGALGLLLSLWGAGFLWSFRPPTPSFTQAALDFGVDGRVALFTLGLAVATSLLFGLVPALRSTRPDLVAALKGETPVASVAEQRFSLRDLLVAGQMALCFLLLTGAVLFLKSLHRAQQIDPGFDAERLLMMTLNLGDRVESAEQGRAFHDGLLETLAGRSGINAVALASNQPFTWGSSLAWKVVPEGGTPSGTEDGVLIRTNAVSPSYLATMGIPLLRGRGFTNSDREDTPPVAVINATMALQLWPGLDPLGRRFRVQETKLVLEVVGVAADSKYVSLGEDPTPFFYLPLAQRYAPEVTLYVRTRGSPSALLEPVRREVHALDRSLTLSNVYTLSEVVSTSLWAQKLGATLLTLFGVLALVLSATGIYGVLSYTVKQRLKEVGIRMVLGAGRQAVARLLVGRAMLVVAAGLALGLAAAVASGRLLAGLLYGIHPSDPATYAEIAAVLAAVAALASYTAARRAMRVDPAQILQA